jgi:hypothetical protein
MESSKPSDSTAYVVLQYGGFRRPRFLGVFYTLESAEAYVRDLVGLRYNGIYTEPEKDTEDTLLCVVRRYVVAEYYSEIAIYEAVPTPVAATDTCV